MHIVFSSHISLDLYIIHAMPDIEQTRQVCIRIASCVGRVAKLKLFLLEGLANSL